MDPRIIIPQELTVDAFAPYGQAVLPPPKPAPRFGDDWDCWFGVGDLGGSRPMAGIVLTRRPSGFIEGMEREPTIEYLLPISGPIVQVVALPGNLNDHTEHPDAATVQAFIVRPGQSIGMKPGTWHYAALPWEKGETLYYYFLEPHPPEPGQESGAWISFKNDDSLNVRLPE